MAKPTPENAPIEVNPLRQNGPIGWFQRSLVAGIIVFAPIGITIWALWSFVDFVDTSVQDLLPMGLKNSDGSLPFWIPGFGLISAIVLLTLLGSLATNVVFRFFLRLGERIVDRVPLVGAIYGILKQVFSSFGGGASKSFKEVVLAPFPHEGAWAIGFVTSESNAAIDQAIGSGKIGVFVPTVPNPTTGFLLYIEPERLRKLDIPVEDGLKMVLSFGIVSKEVEAQAAPSPTR